MNKKLAFAGKALIAAICAMGLAQTTTTPVSAIDQNFMPTWSSASEYEGNDSFYKLIPTSDGGYFAAGSSDCNEGFSCPYAQKFDANGNKVPSQTINAPFFQANFALQDIVETDNAYIFVISGQEGPQAATFVTAFPKDFDVTSGNFQPLFQYWPIEGFAFDAVLNPSNNTTYIYGWAGPYGTQSTGSFVTIIDNTGVTEPISYFPTDYYIIMAAAADNNIFYVSGINSDGFASVSAFRGKNTNAAWTLKVAPNAVFYNITKSGNNIFAVGETADGKALIAKIEATGSSARLLWVKTYDPSEYNDAFYSATIKGNSIVAVGRSFVNQNSSQFFPSIIQDSNGATSSGIVAEFDQKGNLVSETAIAGDDVAFTDSSNAYNQLVVTGGGKSANSNLLKLNGSNYDGFLLNLEKTTSLNISFNISGKAPSGRTNPIDTIYVWENNEFYYYDNGEKRPLSDFTKAAAAGEFTLDGFYTDAARTKKLDLSQKPESDLTLYAAWTRTVTYDERYLCNYNGNIITCEDNNTPSVTAEESTELQPFLPEDFTPSETPGEWTIEGDAATIDQDGKLTALQAGEVYAVYRTTDADGTTTYEYRVKITITEKPETPQESGSPDGTSPESPKNPNTLDSLSTILLISGTSAAILGLCIIYRRHIH